MPIEHIHSFLVHPSKHAEEQPEISGTPISHRGKLYKMLSEVYARAPTECNIEIVFRPDKDGQQVNECHDCIVAYATDPKIDSGRAVAERLQRVTTNRSGLGLLFLLQGTNGKDEHALVISRFPADQGIVAHEDAKRLSVEFIERVFMKSARAYKSALFTTASLEAGFPEGRAVDKQIQGPRDLSAYWITEFLEAELRTTGPAGTRRLAVAVRDAVRTSTELDLKQELVAVARLLRGQQGRTISAHSVLQQLGLSEEATSAIEHAFARPELMGESFQFDSEEFDKHVMYRTVELDTGAMLLAEDSKWDELFLKESLSSPGRVRYSTEGEVVDERLKKTK